MANAADQTTYRKGANSLTLAPSGHVVRCGETFVENGLMELTGKGRLYPGVFVIVTGEWLMQSTEREYNTMGFVIVSVQWLMRLMQQIIPPILSSWVCYGYPCH